jgi:metallo-beta-lactamase family protein
MRLSFLGGTEGVTGSCFKLAISNLSLLIDCGMMQEKAAGEQDLPVKEAVDYCLLTHAHLDHCGLLPLLVKRKKLKGHIISTPATKRLAEIVLRDAVKIQQDEGVSLYTDEDVDRTLEKWEVHDYGEFFLKGIKIALYDAAHILGSSSIAITYEGTTVLFSGDIGTRLTRLMDYPPKAPKEIDYLILESTYGDKLHQPVPKEEIKKIFTNILTAGGKVLIPAFAIGRTQEILLLLKEFKLPYPVYLDSPMAQRVTSLSATHFPYLHKRLQKLGLKEDIFAMENLRCVNTNNQSKELAESKEPCIIIAASGMLTGGRVLNHLPHILNDEKSAIVFVGYQAENTKGRAILEGKLPHKCTIKPLSGFSAHADQKELLAYVDRFSTWPYKIFLVHGEDSARKTLWRELRKRKLKAILPKQGETYTLVGGTKEEENLVKCDFTLHFIPFYDYQIAPVTGAVVEEAGNLILRNEEWLKEVIEAKKKELENVTQMTYATPEEGLETIPTVSLEEFKAHLKDFREKGYLSKAKLRDFKEKLEMGKQAAISWIKENEAKGRFRGMENTPEEIQKQIAQILMAGVKLPKEEVLLVINTFL